MRLKLLLPWLFVWLVCIAVPSAAQQAPVPAQKTPKVYTNTKLDREKIARSNEIPKPLLNQKDSMLALLKTQPDDTAKLSTLIELCRNMVTNSAPSETKQYALSGCRLADSLLTLDRYRNSYIVAKNQARAYNVLAIPYCQEGNFEKGHQYYYKALLIRKKINDSSGISTSYNNLGTVYRLTGNYVTATAYHLMSLKICEQMKDSSGISYNYYNLGKINFSMNNLKKAREYSEKCVAIRKKTRDMRGLAEALSVLSEVYGRMQLQDLKMNADLQSLRLSDSLGMRQQSAHSYNNIATTYMRTGRLDLALDYYQKALALYHELNDPFFSIRTRSNIGVVYFHKKDFARARKLMLLNLDSVIKYGIDDILEESYDLLAQSDSALGNYKEAFLFSRNHQRLRYKNLNVEKLNKLNELQNKIETSNKEAENRALSFKNQVQTFELNRSRYLMLALAGLLALVFAVGVLLIRQNRLRAEERTRRLEQKLLRAQMNPHFIFNSLQAIQNYILKNDSKEAIRYLSLFATLTRDVLENSRIELIPLYKETNLLKNYLQLQKLRFGNRFEYSVEVDDELDALPVNIPPMLSQPFIENAIEHGMNDIESGGLVHLSFTLKNKTLVMEITDNGKGIQNTNNGPKKHASMAIAITRERIALMNKKARHPIAFSIGEAYPHDPERKGVKVIFTIPLELLH